MANMASVSYKIEGPKETLEKIQQACSKAMKQKSVWDEYLACELLGFDAEVLEKSKLGGEFSDEPEIEDGVLRLCTEERWGLQDFEELLRQKFPDLTIYWVVEECGCEVYCTNDKDGKYFPERYWVDTAQDDVYQSEYFKDEETMWKWLDDKYGVKSKEEVETWNADYEATGDECENFIYIHEFEIID